MKNIFRAIYGKKSSVKYAAVYVTVLFFISAALSMPFKETHAGVLEIFTEIFESSVEYKSYTNSSTLKKTASMPRVNYSTAIGLLALRPALNIDPNPSKGGGDITIVADSALYPEVGPSVTATNEKNAGPESDKISIYVVREGDSLSEIAEMFNVSVNTIAWANDIKRENLIRVGQTLIILPVTGVRHVIERGDTIEKLAKKYKGSVDDIMRYNDIKPGDKLTMGAVLIIPDGEIEKTHYNTNIAARVRGKAAVTYSGYYIRPILGGRKSQGLHGYNAVDLAAPPGTPIMASAAGKVLISRQRGWNGGYGNYVVIKHNNGTQTLYAHTSSNIVSVGDKVVQGQVIGYIGSTGKTTGPHVHFEIRGAKNPF